MDNTTDTTPAPSSTADAGGNKTASEWRDLKKTDAAMYAIARATGFRVDNRMLTEGEYDAAINAAGSITLR